MKRLLVSCVCCEREFSRQLAFFAHFRRKGKCQLTRVEYLLLVGSW